MNINIFGDTITRAQAQLRDTDALMTRATQNYQALNESEQDINTLHRMGVASTAERVKEVDRFA